MTCAASFPLELLVLDQIKSTLHKKLDLKSCPFKSFSVKIAYARTVSHHFSSPICSSLLDASSAWSSELFFPQGHKTNFTGMDYRCIPLGHKDTRRHLQYRSIKVGERLRQARVPNVNSKCHWCLLSNNIEDETIRHRFADCSLTKTIWYWVERWMWPPDAGLLPRLEYTRITGDSTASVIRMSKEQRKLWSIYHVIIVHNIFRVTREKSIANSSSKSEVVARIKARIMVDLESVIRAEWFLASRSHNLIKRFQCTWCSQMNHRITITTSGDGQKPENTYNLENESSNIGLPILHINIRPSTSSFPLHGHRFDSFF